jgi:hypothetical protein
MERIYLEDYISTSRLLGWIAKSSLFYGGFGNSPRIS